MRQITIVNVRAVNDGFIQITAILWLPVDPALATPKPGVSGSAVPGATEDEVNQIKAGTIIEEARDVTLPGTISEPEVEAFLLLVHQSRTNFFASVPFKGAFYGKYFDGSTWQQDKGQGAGVGVVIG